MLDALYEAERLLPKLLLIEEGWSGLYADTEKPALTRVWRQWGENRISLHDFGPCPFSDSFPHLHEWEFAVRILEEECEMGLGRAVPGETSLEFCRVVLKPGSTYQMLGRKSWHTVRPNGPNGYRSLMVSGPPLYRENRIRVNTPSRTLTLSEIRAQLDRFKRYYPR